MTPDTNRLHCILAAAAALAPAAPIAALLPAKADAAIVQSPIMNAVVPANTSGSASSRPSDTLIDASSSFGSGTLIFGSDPGNWVLSATN